MPDLPAKFQLNKQATSEGRRENAHQRGYTRQWNKSVKLFRTYYPECEWCQELGDSVPMHAVDHIIPHHGNDVLFNDPENRQSLCETHHSLKTLGEGRGELVFVCQRQREYIVELNRSIGSHYKILETVKDHDGGTSGNTCS